MGILTWSDVTRSECGSYLNRNACACCNRYPKDAREESELNVGEFEDVKTGELFCVDCGPHSKETCPCRKGRVA